MPRHITKTSYKSGKEHKYWKGGTSDYWRRKAREIVNCPKGMIVHHKDGDFSNNKIENLQIMTQSEHVGLHNKLRKGIKRKSLTRDVASEVIKLKKLNMSYKTIASKLDINTRMVKRCLNTKWQIGEDILCELKEVTETAQVQEEKAHAQAED